MGMIKEVLDDDFEVGPTAASLLGLSNDGMLGRVHGGNGYWGCNWCRDDDAALGSESSFSAVKFGNALSTSKEHQLWEKLFCEKARANSELEGIKDCKFVLSGCHNEDDEGAAVSIANGIATVKPMAKQHLRNAHA